MADILWLIPILPLAGFLINGLFGKRLPRVVVEAIAVLGPFASFGLALAAFFHVRHGGTAAFTYFSWMAAGEFSVDVGLHLDGLSAVMVLVITGVGSLIHLYSVGYMHEDEGVWRYFSYLNLFLFAMLVLVLGDSLPLLFVGWEGVGLCSYLLIGYLYKHMPNAEAGQKAFITNRIGDLGFLIGMFALFSLAGTLGIEGLRLKVSALTLGQKLTAGPFQGWTAGGVIEFATVCLAIGAAGKSAQIPLYVWLPDAMAGPTPVSALIHAATMVTAGIYMIARLNFVYVLAPAVLAGIGIVAAATALLAGVIAIAQNDIKKVLAYSTISQLGFMFCGMAAMTFTAGMFHLVTHAFFKALLFLGAGAIIHALGGEQDIRKMGGLAPQMRWVFLVFAIGGLALAGCWGFSGFYSKDAILVGVFDRMSRAGPAWKLTWCMLVVTVLCTAFYTTRLILLVFFGPAGDRHPHKTGPILFVPLAILAVLSAFGGHLQEGMEHLLKPVWRAHASPGPAAHHAALAYSVGAFALGFVGAVLLYGPWRAGLTRFVEGPGRRLHGLVANKFYVDEIYFWTVIAPIKTAAAGVWFVFDKLFIDTLLVGGTGRAVSLAGGGLRRAQAGTVNVAAGGIVVGVLATLGYLLYRVLLG
ncbi:MAG: NADH-quinone oxidoreductase subunit L [Planctomycetes bacterium]|nr:NADH-quinone oxidoreductase subunit L [Planctomycetota bacterium]